LFALAGCVSARSPFSSESAQAFELRGNVWQPLAGVAPLPGWDDPTPMDSFHAHHAGQIVFTTKDLADDTPLRDAELGRAFDLGSGISIRAFFSEKIESAMRRAGITCHSDPSLSVEPTPPIAGTPSRWDKAPVRFVAAQWTSPVPLYGIKVVVPITPQW